MADHFARLAEGLRPLGVPVAYGFLELAAPLVEEAVADLVARGARSVAVLPVLVAPGRHLARDLPRRAQAASERLGVEVRVLPFLGGEEEFSQALERVARRLLVRRW